MRLIRLTLENFKGARHVVLEPRGSDFSVFGDNATGKSTLADGNSWLLFGKDTRNSATFDVKTLDSDNRPIAGLEHSVEGVYDISGVTKTLKRTYYAETGRVRGTATTKKGNTTDYHINGVPVDKNVFDAEVLELCLTDLKANPRGSFLSTRQDSKVLLQRFRALTDPNFFPEVMEWKDRRTMLFEVCGDVTDEEVFAADPKLAELPKVIGRHTHNEFKAVVESRRTAINKELETTRPRIDEMSRVAAQYATATSDPNRLAILRKQVQDLGERRAEAAVGGALAAKRVELRNLEADMLSIANRLRSGGNPVRDAAQAGLRSKTQEVDTAQDRVTTLTRRLSSARPNLARLNEELGLMKEARKLKKDEKFAGSTVCKSCGQELPEEERAGNEAKFNLEQAGWLERDLARGSALKSQIATLTAEIEGLEADLSAAQAAYERLCSEKAAIVVPESTIVDVASDPQYAEKVAAKAALEVLIQEITGDASDALLEIDAEIFGFQDQIRAAESAAAQVQQRVDAEKRIDELAQNEKTLAAEFEKLGGHLALCEDFIRAKTRMVTDHINSRFKIARFKLFREQENGGLAEICEVMVGGVPYASLNTGMRVNVGLDIIDTLGSHFQFAPPVFIDGAESITEIVPTRGQQIRLTVSKADRTLRFESDGEATSAAPRQLQESLI